MQSLCTSHIPLQWRPARWFIWHVRSDRAGECHLKKVTESELERFCGPGSEVVTEYLYSYLKRNILLMPLEDAEKMIWLPFLENSVMNGRE